ncbi:glycosaminoglycan xylosylkinase homolog [Cylas formicarius]|uniref:glycosaminoglycan xylosylkinase homolog n=1 Tax=Cylas formicarius TaxID=197179 RepID=UPI0029588FC5|nr:glycosaminoglycan xylosylkinase homolog [Cylas formicarius]
MFRRKTLLLGTAVIAILFLLINYYLLSILTLTRTDIEHVPTVEDFIWLEYQKLNSYYRARKSSERIFLKFVKHLSYLDHEALPNLWAEVSSWISDKQLFDALNPKLGTVINELKHAPIVKADLDNRGTQLKLLLTLEGNQDVIFKPKWYEKDEIIRGEVYAGKDRYGAEIVAFYLSILIGKPLTPIIAERNISLKKDVLPAATKRLLNTSFTNKLNRSCIYGSCFYCKREDPICDNENDLLRGAVILDIKRQLKSHRSPWQRTYKKGKMALWQESENYCSTVAKKLSKQRLLDLIDTAIFDFLIQNGDRHHYETLDEMVVLLDNGKGLGDPGVHHLDILAPLYQCCMIRQQTWKSLLRLTGGKIEEYIRTVPDIESSVAVSHWRAMDQRLLLIFATVEYCKQIKKLVIHYIYCFFVIFHYTIKPFIYFGAYG